MGIQKKFDVAWNWKKCSDLSGNKQAEKVLILLTLHACRAWHGMHACIAYMHALHVNPHRTARTLFFGAFKSYGSFHRTHTAYSV